MSELLPPVALRAVVTLGLPELISHGVTDVEALAATAGADPMAVGKLLRYLAVLDVVSRAPEGHYKLTDVGDELTQEFVVDALDLNGPIARQELALFGLLDAVRSGQSSYASVFGTTLAQQRAETGFEASYQEQISKYARFIAPALAADKAVAGRKHVVVHSEGAGVMGQSLTADQSGPRVSIIGLPSKIAYLRDDLQTSIDDAARKRIDLVEQSMFEKSPAADAILMVKALDEHPDADAVRALKQAAAALEPDGNLLVVEHPLDEASSDDHETEENLKNLVLYGTGHRRCREPVDLQCRRPVTGRYPDGRLGIHPVRPQPAGIRIRPLATTAAPPGSSPTDHKPAKIGVARNNTTRTAGLVVAGIALVVVVLVSMAVGSKHLALPVVWDALFHPGDIADHYVIRDLRLPRTVVGLLAGAALGVSGALIQALTRNPLADPGILGVNAGAAFFVAIAIGGFGLGSISGYLWFAFAGAPGVTFAVYLIGSAGRGSVDPVRLVLSGVALGAVLGGITTGMTLLDPRAFDQMRSWNAGSIIGRGFDVVSPVVPFLGVGMLLAVLAARPLNAIALGEDKAAALGVNVARTRGIVVAAVTLLAGGVTAIAGPIGFVGVVVPHIARWIVGPDQRWILAYTMLLAPSLLLIADVVGRIVTRPGEIPVGIVTAFVGAPVLIVLIRRKNVSGL